MDAQVRTASPLFHVQPHGALESTMKIGTTISPLRTRQHSASPVRSLACPQKSQRSTVACVLNAHVPTASPLFCPRSDSQTLRISESTNQTLKPKEPTVLPEHTRQQSASPARAWT